MMGDGTSEHVNKLNILPGFCLWCNNFHFVLCGILASWDNVLFLLYYFFFCNHNLMKYDRFCNWQLV